jgi:hypothetical protein
MGLHSRMPVRYRTVTCIGCGRGQAPLKARSQRLQRDGTRTETRFRLSAKRTSPFKSAGASVQSTAGSRGVRISGSNAGYTVFRGSVKSTGYPLHSPVSPSLPVRQCVPSVFKRTLPLQTPAGTRHHENTKTACVAPEIRTLNLPSTNQFGQPSRQKTEENIFMADPTSFFHFYLLSNSTIMRRLTTGIRSEKYVVRRFRRCANVIQCTCTNLDSTV